MRFQPSVSAVILTVLGLMTMEASAKVITKPIEYKDGDVVLEGFLAYDDAIKDKAPGVLIVHEWWGCNDYAKRRAQEIAGLGYVAFALDMYGKGKSTTQREEAQKFSGQFYGDTKLMRSRAKAGYDILAGQPNVDPKRIAAIGYCFGGTVVLQLAAGNAVELVGVVSFHGGLGGVVADAKPKARILVCHGADDPFIPQKDIDAFQESMKKTQADWQMIYFGGAVHAFTNPGQDGKSLPGAKYDEAADKRSWDYMQMFFKECFAAKK